MFRNEWELGGASREGGVDPLEAIAIELEALTRWNERVLGHFAAQGRPLPPLYASGVRYALERRGEVWLDCVRVLELRHGDCEDLAAWRCAELRLAGDPGAVTMFSARPRGSGRLIHIVVLHGNGELEDPSRALGMGRE